MMSIQQKIKTRIIKVCENMKVIGIKWNFMKDKRKKDASNKAEQNKTATSSSSWGMEI